MLDYWVEYAGSPANANEETTEGTPVRYFLREGEDILTDRDLEREFSEHKGDPDLPTTFEEFLELCQWYNNGSLTELNVWETSNVHITEKWTTDDGVVEEKYDDKLFRVRYMKNYERVPLDHNVSVTILDGEIVEAKGKKGLGKYWVWKKGE